MIQTKSEFLTSLEIQESSHLRCLISELLVEKLFLGKKEPDQINNRSQRPGFDGASGILVSMIHFHMQTAKQVSAVGFYQPSYQSLIRLNPTSLGLEWLRTGWFPGSNPGGNAEEIDFTRKVSFKVKEKNHEFRFWI